jgi:Zn-dependent protease
VLYALGVPLNFLALLVGFGLAILARGLAQAWTARALGGRDFELRARSRPDPRRHGDIFGLVAAVLGGTGWGREAPINGVLGRFSYGRARGRPAVNAAIVLLSGPLAAAVLGVAAVLGARAAGAPAIGVHDVVPSDALHGDLALTGAGERALLLIGVAALAVAILALVPVPPLDGGRFVLAVAPTTAGWQRVRHYAHQNWGIGVLLVLLIIPLGTRAPVLLAVVDAVGEPILRALGR